MGKRTSAGETMVVQVSFRKDGTHWCATCAGRAWSYGSWTTPSGAAFCPVCVTELIPMSAVRTRPHEQHRGVEYVEYEQRDRPRSLGRELRDTLVALPVEERIVVLERERARGFDPPVLHLHAQASHHDDAYIVGNSGGLRALRDAIDRALLADENTGVADVLVNDGEGFAAIVLRDDTSWSTPTSTLGKALAPYTDTELCPPIPGAIAPWDRRQNP